jgi:hypothetical protein
MIAMSSATHRFPYAGIHSPTSMAALNQKLSHWFPSLEPAAQ